VLHCCQPVIGKSLLLQQALDRCRIEHRAQHELRLSVSDDERADGEDRPLEHGAAHYAAYHGSTALGRALFAVA
jgi:hypothetical protein